MKQFKTTLIAFLLCIAANAQDTVEKSLFNVQTGSAGLWGSHEARLTNKFALRTEIGFDAWVFEATNGEKSNAFVPSISAEPRWYYNITKRAEKGKTTGKNSANFFSINFEYYPDLFVIGNLPNNIYMPNQIDIIPKWGIRRHFDNSNFNYEVGFGIGYKAYLNDDDSKIVKSGTGNVAVDIHLRLGYTF